MKTCLVCQKSFEPIQTQQKYCSKVCKNKVCCARAYRKHRNKRLERSAVIRDRDREKYRESCRRADAKRRQSQLEKSRAWRDAYPWRRLIQYARIRARDMNLAFELDDKWAKQRWTGICEVSKLPFCLDGSKENRAFWPSIDRIDPSKGYTKENSRFLLFKINWTKYNKPNDPAPRIAEELLATLDN